MYGYYDYNIIPDSHNTGCAGSLTKVNTAGTVDGVAYGFGDNGTTLVMDLYYSNVNKNLPEIVIIKDKDFSDYKFAIRHISMSDVKRVIYFDNCKFAAVTTDVEQEMVEFHFNNCSFVNYYGSQSTFTRCFFGGSGGDGLNPFRNVTVKECYFSEFPQDTGGNHADGMQVYGKAGIDAENIIFRNCRMEMPIIASRKGGINACFMVQLEFSTGRNYLFEDCIINGGGYTIYARGTRGQEIYDVIFRNISIGRGRLYGEVYPDVSENVVFENKKETTMLYVASVWKDSVGTIHLSVTNDTAEDKTLLVVTESGKQEFLIPCKATAEANGALEYYDLPIDIDITVADTETDWVVCYDGAEKAENQIRFVNWGSEPVYRIVE